MNLGVDVLAASPPRYTPEEAHDLAHSVFGVTGVPIALDSERDQNFRIDAEDGHKYLLKLSNAAETEAVVACETEALLHITRTDPALPLARPRAIREGKGYWELRRGSSGHTHFVRLFTFLEGHHAQPQELDRDAVHAFGVTLARLARALRGFWHTGAGRHLLWDTKQARDLRPLLPAIEDPARRALAARALDRCDEHALPMLGSLRAQVVHNDFTLDNTVFGADDRVCGIVDFGDLVHTALVSDLSIALASLAADRPDPEDVAASLLSGYDSVTRLENEELAVVGELLGARLVALVAIAAWRLEKFPDNAAYIVASVESAARLLQWLEDGGFDALENAGRQRAATSLRTTGPEDDGDLVARRRRVLGSALSPLTYDRPLHLVRGEGVWLYDSEGRAYIDAYNNVPVVGHCHPRVADALSAQAHTLNTNLRYLHPAAIELGERLSATMPEGLDTCLFVNSGSEANDVAWRLARAASGGSGAIVTSHAYHGVTELTANLSPESWERGVSPPYVATVPAPDPFGGAHRDTDPDWVAPYVDDIARALDALAERGHSPAAVFLDAGFTSDGILTPPPEYVRALADAARAAGALFVADEVQTGFGRFGDHMWGFEAFGLVPDVVTLGKAMGNGHPVAAVVTRADVVDAFAATTEFFSTFGGNPVACVAALAVLDVIRDEGLMARAVASGAALRGRLARAAGRAGVGEVRGRGLLTGVALVHDTSTRAPDSSLAARVANDMRERGVLVGTTGPDDNVLKIRPPLAFAMEHVDLVARAFEGALGI